LGVWLKKEAHGSHYGQEAVEAVVAWVSAYVDCDDLIYPVDKRNTASRKIPERLGGEIIGERNIQNESGTILDEFVYRIPLMTDAG
jgi:RimJ/RimL family protein N-acetyltransferase